MILLVQIRNGDQNAFTDLYDVYYQSLCDYGFRFVNDPDLMEDVVQDVFVWIWEKRKYWNPKPGVTIRAYLYRAVHNRVIMKARKKRYECPFDEYTEENILHHQPQVDEIENQRIQNAIKESIDLLPEKRREILILSLIQGLTYEEIASILDISVNTVHTQIKRARKLLRNQLKPFWPYQDQAKAV